MVFVQTLAIGIILAFVVFAALNLLASIIFRLAPNLLASPEERLRSGYIDRFEGDLKPYLNDWFGLSEGMKWEEFAAEYRRNEINIYEHEPFSEYKHPVRTGQYINISPHGFRFCANQGNWPPEEKFFNIFIFGGSSLLNVGPDWTTIPSYMQEMLNQLNVDKEVRTYNFGRGAYFSTLEKNLFFKLLTEGIKSDLVIFLNGANDAFFYHGLPATSAVFTKAINDMNQEISEGTRNQMRASPKWSLLKGFVNSLPLARAASLLKRRQEAAQAGDIPPLSAEQVDAVIKQWQHNRTQIEAVGKSYDIPILFVWQPSAAYKYDLNYHKALPYHGSLHGHERSGQVYEQMQSSLGEDGSDDNFVWLADIQEGVQEALYLDSVHYNAGFNRVIAGKIVDAMVDRELMPMQES